MNEPWRDVFVFFLAPLFIWVWMSIFCIPIYLIETSIEVKRKKICDFNRQNCEYKLFYDVGHYNYWQPCEEAPFNSKQELECEKYSKKAEK